MTRVLVLARSSAMRAGIRTLLEGADLEIVGETAALALTLLGAVG